MDPEKQEKIKETLLILTTIVLFVTLGGGIQLYIGNTSSIGMFFAMLWGWMIFSGLLIFFLAWRTNAFTEVMAQLRRMPATIFLPRAGNGKIQIPDKIKDGWAWFKPRKGLSKSYILTQNSIFKIGKTEYNIAFEDKSAIIPPYILDCAINLRDAGFNTMTTAEIALELANIEEKYDVKLSADTKAIQTTDSEGEAVILNLDKIIEERMNNKFIDYRQDTKTVLQKHLQEKAKTVLDDLYAMKQFFTYDITPGVIDEFEACIRAEEQEKARQGLFGGISKQTAITIVILLMGLATVWILLVQTNSLDGLVGSIAGASGSGTSVT